MLHLRHKPLEHSFLLSDFSPQSFYKESHLPVFPLTNLNHSDAAEKQNHIFPEATLV